MQLSFDIKTVKKKYLKYVSSSDCIEEMYIARFQTWCKHLPLDAIKTEVTREETCDQSADM